MCVRVPSYYAHFIRFKFYKRVIFFDKTNVRRIFYDAAPADDSSIRNIFIVFFQIKESLSVVLFSWNYKKRVINQKKSINQEHHLTVERFYQLLDRVKARKISIFTRRVKFYFSENGITKYLGFLYISKNDWVK